VNPDENKLNRHQLDHDQEAEVNESGAAGGI